MSDEQQPIDPREDLLKAAQPLGEGLQGIGHTLAAQSALANLMHGRRTEAAGARLHPGA